MGEDIWDLVVIGAGAAGLLAAARAAEGGLRVILVEKNRKVAVKILMSGGTRCNLTQATNTRGIIAAFGSQGPFLHSALAALSPQALVELVEAEGVPTKVEETGKIFPVSDRAADVAEAFVRRLQRSGATLAVEEAVLGMHPLPVAQPTETRFEVTTSRRRLTATRVLITTGGQSYPGCGTTGDGYGWAEAFGHTVTPRRPALVPITTTAAWVAELSGITLPDVTVSLWDPALVSSARCRTPGADGWPAPPSSSGVGVPRSLPARAAESRATRRGSLLFAHFGLSGPAALDVSRVVSGHAEPRTLQLTCDLVPAVAEPALAAQLRDSLQAAGKKSVQTVLSQVLEILPRRVVEAVLSMAAVPGEQRAGEAGKQMQQRLVQTVKHLPIPVSGTLGFKKAEVTAGGVALTEVDSRTMQSLRVPGLYFAGEVLDLDGPIGGYNFQAAFSTGWLAAERML